MSHPRREARKALEGMIRACSEKGWRTACALMGNSQDAEDLLQQAFLIAASKSDKIPHKTPWPWFARILTLEAMNARRKRAKIRAQQGNLANEVNMPADEPALDKLLKEEEAAALRNALNELPSQERDALTLLYISGLTQAEAADALNIPLGTLKKRAGSGRANLRERLKRDKLDVVKALALLPFAAPPMGLALATEGWVAASLKAMALGAGGTIVKKTSAALIALVILAMIGVSSTIYLMNDTDGDEETSIASKPSSKERKASQESSGRHASNGKHEIVTKTKEQNANKRDPKSTKNPETLPTKENQPAPIKEEVKLPGVAFRATLSGIVVDIDGLPVPDAEVSAVKAKDGSYRQRALSLSGSATSGADGGFEIAVDGRREEDYLTTYFSLVAKAKGYSASRTYRYSMRGGESIEGIRLPLRRFGGEIRGVVLDENSRTPISGASIRAESWMRAIAIRGARDSSLRMDVPNNFESAEVFSNDRGEFTIRNLPQGEFTLHARLPREGEESATLPNADAPPSPSSQSKRVTIRGNSNAPDLQEVEILLPSFEVLKFSLSPAIDSPVYLDLQVTRRSNAYNGGGFGVGVEPRRDGSYRADWLRVDHRFALIKADGFEQKIIPIAPRRGQTLDLGEIKLKKGLVLEGRVESDDGSPIGGADVWLRRSSMAGGGFARQGGYKPMPALISATSDANGRFVLDGLPANGSFEVAAIADDFAEGFAKLRLTTGSAPERFKVVLSKAGTLVGHVERPSLAIGGGADGMLIDDVVVLAAGARTRVQRTTAMDSRMLGFLAGSAKIRIELDHDGSFRAEGLAPGTYFGIAMRDRRITFQSEVVIRAGQETRVEFTFPPPGGLVEGRLTRRGKAISGRGMQLSFAPVNGRPKLGGAYTETDREGYYRFSGVRNGSFILRVSGEPRDDTEAFLDERSIEMSEGKRHEINIDLKEFRARISGQATIGGESVFAYARLRSSDPSLATRDLHSLVQADGSYAINEVPAGEYQIWFTGGTGFQGQFAAAASVSVEDEVEEVSFSKDFKGASYTGKISIPSLEGGYPKITIAARRSFNASFGKVTDIRATTEVAAQSDGSFVFPTLWAGKYRITVKAAGFAAKILERSISGDIQEEILLETEAGTIKLELSSINGVHPKTLERGSRAEVELRNAQDEVVEKRTLYYGKGQSNAVDFEGLVAGTYRALITGGSVETTEITGLVVQVGKQSHRLLDLYGAAWVKFEVSAAEGQPSNILFTKGTRKLLREDGSEIAPLPYPSPMQARLVTNHFFLMPMAAGNYEIQIKIEGFALLTKSFEVERGGKETITLTFVEE